MKSNELMDNADILMEMDSDKYPDRETAMDYLFERQQQVINDDEEEEQPQNTLLEALTRPVQ